MFSSNFLSNVAEHHDQLNWKGTQPDLLSPFFYLILSTYLLFSYPIFPAKLSESNPSKWAGIIFTLKFCKAGQEVLLIAIEHSWDYDRRSVNRPENISDSR
jgi:hypothetical protein